LVSKMARLPIGTVTFLFTDIEGSTRLLQELREGYADVLAEHRALLREAFARHGGIEVDTSGDAFFVAFGSAREAVAAAMEAQVVVAGRVRIRIGLHTGEAQLIDDGYVGIDVHRAARIAAAGHGGQTVLSQSTRDLVDADVRDLGFHRLKGFSEPQRLYQLGRDDFPPLATRTDTNLPVPPTLFVGRDDELGEVSELLSRPETRLVTITGPGGSGKTRLALRTAEGSQDEFPDGVWFVDFAPLDDPALVLPTIARVVGARDEVAAHLGDKRLLLVLDTFEHVAAAALEISRLLSACPGVQVLATSREPLHIAGEQEYGLRSLSVPDAVVLFRQRARLVRDDVPLSAVDEKICRRLDCLPLAIELAAARVKVLEPEELLVRLEHRLPLLVLGPRDLPERQRTLRATIDWSYRLLSLEEQRLLAGLSVFVGGFTAAGAEEVCGAGIDALQSLIDKSFIELERGRLRMLDTIREFALELLEGSGRADETRRRHAEHALRLAAEFEERRGDWEAHLASLNRDDDDLRAAAEWLVQADPDKALQLVVDLARYWGLQDRQHECDYWLTKAIQRARAADPTLRSIALRIAGDTAFFLGDEERARRLFHEALAIAAEAEAKKEMAAALINLGRAEEGLALYREVGWGPGVAVTLHRLADAARDRGDFARARLLYAESVAAWRRLGIAWGLGNVLHGFADCALDQRSLDEATALYREALRIAVDGPSELRVAYCLAGLAAVAAAKRRKEVASRLWGGVELIERVHDVQLQRRERARYERLVRPMLRTEEEAPESDQTPTLAAVVASALEFPD
jgi:predicted ATPase/class 3 adenylate cyclase